MSHLLMPLWEFGIGDVVDAVVRHNPGWHSVQLQYGLVPKGRPGHLDVEHMEEGSLIEGKLIKVPYQWGAGAYLISRKGMEVVLDAYATNRTAQSALRPKCEGKYAIDSPVYYYDLFTENYMTLPQMFMPAPDTGSDKQGKGLQSGWQEDILDDALQYAVMQYSRHVDSAG